MADRYTYDEEVVLIGSTETPTGAGDTVIAAGDQYELTFTVGW